MNCCISRFSSNILAFCLSTSAVTVKVRLPLFRYSGWAFCRHEGSRPGPEGCAVPRRGNQKILQQR